MEKLPRKIPHDDKLLAKFTVFAELGADEIHTLLEQSGIESYPAGERIINAGDVGHCMYVILSGNVCVTVNAVPEKSNSPVLRPAIFWEKLPSLTMVHARQTSPPPSL